MKIRNISLMNYRNYEELNIELGKDVNVFQGENAQGKTNVLESIYYCAFGRSHRTAKSKDLIQWEKENARIRVYIEKDRLDKTIEINLLTDGKKSISVNKVRLHKIGDLLGILNVVMFSPEDLKIVKESPGLRRKFLDMEISQLDRRYYNALVVYNQILAERGALLKSRRVDRNILDIYDQKLAQEASYIAKQRVNYIHLLNVHGQPIHQEITTNKEEIRFEYKCSFSLEGNLQDNLKKELSRKREMDMDRGTTSAGIHRDDFTIRINGADAKDFGSQGQQRTAVLTMKFASLEIIRKINGEYPILLLDDVLSELDLSRKKFILKSIENIQTVITCTGVENIEEYLTGNYRLFNVVNGTIMTGGE
ncbi:DNA replication/repair protein RecF [Proteiniclasticum sp. BAD-10]|uniref:DNA replication and repair protein RecF n=1 Tax=Proteiniclasticum sediminis TaxID=2804028 RepID=A0A941HQL0_9CLOT|nr:DNA replication/repair protein RecF [Proteiniclasticum sediminis]MBR0576536.1 DNA replication/repair protein RecF [Proteiniclasticum sediminis]